MSSGEKGNKSMHLLDKCLRIIIYKSIKNVSQKCCRNDTVVGARATLFFLSRLKSVATPLLTKKETALSCVRTSRFCECVLARRSGLRRRNSRDKRVSGKIGTTHSSDCDAERLRHEAALSVTALCTVHCITRKKLISAWRLA